jgi:hypothetical protein
MITTVRWSRKGSLWEMASQRIAAVPGGCWLWLGTIQVGGYGRLDTKAFGPRMAHRIMYELVHGPIPGGLQLDHLCRNRGCVNPDHLEPVTPRENLMRSPLTRARQNADKTHCNRGHEFNDSNTRLSPAGTKVCRPCMKMHSRAAYERKKAGGH